MGQFGNQPDFAAIVDTVSSLPTQDNSIPRAIYIGALTSELNKGSITVRPVGNTVDVTFNGISSGTFLPVMVTAIKSATNISVESILLYR